MDTAAQIEKFLQDVKRVNRREIILGIVAIPVLIAMMAALGLLTDDAGVGSLAFFGFLLLILAMLLNIGIMWFIAAPRGDLNSHPASNVEHWASEMLRRAKLLRSVYLWGLGPTVPGVILLLWPRDAQDTQDWIAIAAAIVLVVVVFGVIAWLNIRAASKLTLEANSLQEAQPAG